MADENAPKVQIRYQDVPELAETFADSVGQWHFDGGTLRIDFLVTRFDPTKSPAEARTGSKLPVCRLVLTPAGTAELLTECRRITAALEKAGVVKSGKAEVAQKPVN